MVDLYAQKGFGKITNCLYKSKNTQQIETMLAEYGSPALKRYSYSDLKKITKSFHEKLGKEAMEACSKVHSKMVVWTSHANAVSLLGFCFDGKKRALVYEFLPNGSLEKYIYSEKPKLTLGWDKLYHIAIGIARGLEYLHRGCGMCIVHFDIKPRNILLDEFCLKNSDFGLAKYFGAVATKSDVYSYGMMILETVGGKKNVKACADRIETEEIARQMILVGLWCIQTLPANRPSMTKVIEMLEGRNSDKEMPPKPSFSSPIHSNVNSPIDSKDALQLA
ncbi:hypothetical protein ZIOFF_014115 [Zingiber officinale]|uniref:non-specific serine/threonine protein kinase n=1 Tax=Zingiber officinale TaxID=94328 RepID=A0A8J5LLD9_ZINOF|nr:hypothetical protein ZIOFF_014115 [Zingiber officinale]